MRRKLKWCGPHDPRERNLFKNFLLAGRCKAEVYPSATSVDCVWHTFDAHGVGGENAEEPSLHLAKLAAMNALKAAKGGSWHIGQRSLAELKKLVALTALEGRVHGH